MASTTKVPLGADTLVRKWCLDVNTGTYASPVWTGVFGIMEFKPTYEQEQKDNSDFDSGGAKSATVTAYSWGAEFKVRRATLAADGSAYDAGQEALRAASLLLGEFNKKDVRFYEVTASGPKTEAYRGYVAVEWNEDGGPMDELDTVSVKLVGKGARTAITHPDAAGAVPTLTSITPSSGSTSGGELVEIHGTGFMANGVDDIVADTGIKFGGTGGTAADGWITESDNVVFVITPAHAAGTVEVVIYNSNGVSTVTQNFVYS